MELIRAEETAIRLGVTTGTLAVWRATKRYPLAYVKIGRKVRYRVEDIENFVRARTLPGIPEENPEQQRGRLRGSRRGNASAA
jgi:hypothetical protein